MSTVGARLSPSATFSLPLTVRYGTTTLFAALNILDGTVIGRCMQRHRHQEFLRFLGAVEAVVPAGKLIHCILDNYGTHKHPKVLAWLARHPRWTFHFTPTSGSWLNAVETFFSALTRRRLRRGVFRSIVELQEAINRYIEEHNDDPVRGDNHLGRRIASLHLLPDAEPLPQRIRYPLAMAARARRSLAGVIL